MSDLKDLYQEIILDHYRRRLNAGLREPYDLAVSHFNPSCGDELELRLRLEDGRIADLSYQAEGCAISQASISVMTELVIGLAPAEALALYDGFLAMLEGHGQVALDEDRYGDAIAFNGVAQFPARLKCALLGWAALRDALLRTEIRS